jgi:hypothetical protein
MAKAANFAIQKGKRCERAVVGLLQPIVDTVYMEAGYSEENTPKLERNLMQSMKGGHDIVGLEWMALEVKCQETLHLKDWWSQAKRQAGPNMLPILIYKQNRVKWRVVMFGVLQSDKSRVKCPVDIALETFLVWFKLHLQNQLPKR